jgi:hypothetical protein
MDSHRNNKAFVQKAKRLELKMSVVVRLVHVWFPIETYMKVILSRSTKTNNNRVIQLYSWGPPKLKSLFQKKVRSYVSVIYEYIE